MCWEREPALYQCLLPFFLCSCEKQSWACVQPSDNPELGTKSPKQEFGKSTVSFYSAIFWDNTKESQGEEAHWIKRHFRNKDLLVRCLKEIGSKRKTRLSHGSGVFPVLRPLCVWRGSDPLPYS